MSYTCNFLHIVFHTHKSRPTIPEESKTLLFAYINSLCNNHHIKLVRINSHLDHLHMLVRVGSTFRLDDFIKVLKQATSARFKGKTEFPKFDGWAREYGAFSVSYYDVERVRQYIIGQGEHHKDVTFRDEFATLLHLHGMELSEYTFNDD